VIGAIVDLALIVVSKGAPVLIAGKLIVLKPPTQVFISLIQKIL